MKESQKVVEVLTFESVDEIFWRYHSNETFQEYFHVIQSNPVTMDTEVAIESDCINGVSVLSGFYLTKCMGFPSPGTKQTVHNNEVSVLNGCP